MLKKQGNVFIKGSIFTTFTLPKQLVLYEVKRISPKGQEEWMDSYQN